MSHSRSKISLLVVVPEESIQSKIYLIRGEKVMLDRDLAILYGVETRVLKQAVNRNLDRFPVDFMFQLNQREFQNWRSQSVISKSDRMGLRWRPFVFTEQGVAMLSSVLNSKRAVQVNIQIMRTFTKLRKWIAGHDGLRKKIEAMERKYDHQFSAVFETIKQLLDDKQKPVRRIGFLRG